MPRGRDECWQEVNRTLDEETGKRHPRVTCKHCLTEWTSNEKARVIEHLQRCGELPEPLWRTYQPHRLDPTLPSAAELQQQQRARTRGIGSMSAGEQDAATAACAHWIHAAGLSPSTTTEHPAFRAFVRTLRPAFRPPSRQQLTHALVDAPLMLIAYLADPQERHRRPAMLDNGGNEETQSRALQAFVLKYYCDGQTGKAAGVLGALSQLRVRQGVFGNNMVWMAADQMTPIQWWQNFWIEEQPELAELCMIALAIAPPPPPPSAAAPPPPPPQSHPHPHPHPPPPPPPSAHNNNSHHQHQQHQQHQHHHHHLHQQHNNGSSSNSSNNIINNPNNNSSGSSNNPNSSNNSNGTGDAVVERNWSPHSFVHILKRNALPPDIISRLMCRFWSLRIKHGWVEDAAAAGGGNGGGGGGGGGGLMDGVHADADAEFTPDVDGYMGMQG